MTQRFPRSPYILRYVYGIMAVVIVAVGGLLSTLYFTKAAERELHDRIAEFHLPSNSRARLMLADAKALSRLFHNVEARREAVLPGPQGTGIVQKGYEGVLFSMRTGLNRIQDLQRRFGDERYSATLDRFAEGLTRIDNNRSESTVADVAALTLALRQFERLHTIATEDTWMKLIQLEHETPLIGLAGIFISGLLMVWILIRLLTTAMDKEQQAVQALADSNERMHHMQKLEALGLLVGGVAHDFNNLMTAVLGQAGLLRARHKDDESLQFGLEQISQAGQQAVALTRQLLAFSRRHPIQPRPIDLNGLVREMETMLAPLIGEDIELATDCRDDLYPVLMDPGQMRQVILNLAINARDAMPAGGRLSIATSNITISAEEFDAIPAGRYARLRVSDNGIGMDEETRARIFEPFFTTKERGRGTGLGLSTVYGIIAEADGRILVQSHPSEGACFDIYLPKAEEPVGLEPPVARSERGTGSGTILVVEDDEQIRQFLHQGLTESGYRVLLAPDGPRGLEICRSENGAIDVILSDVIMPEMSGPEFMASALRLRPAAVPIYMSGYTYDVALEKGLNGDVPLFDKPFELTELVQLIRDRLSLPIHDRAGFDPGSWTAEQRSGSV